MSDQGQSRPVPVFEGPLLGQEGVEMAGCGCCVAGRPRPEDAPVVPIARAHRDGVLTPTLDSGGSRLDRRHAQ